MTQVFLQRCMKVMLFRISDVRFRIYLNAEVGISNTECDAWGFINANHYKENNCSKSEIEHPNSEILQLLLPRFHISLLRRRILVRSWHLAPAILYTKFP